MLVVCLSAGKGLHPQAVTLHLALGETLWSRPSSFGGNASVLRPLLQVPDVDADGAPDLLVLTREDGEVGLLLSPHSLLCLQSTTTSQQSLGLTTSPGMRPGPCAPGICRLSTLGGSVPARSFRPPQEQGAGSASHGCHAALG